MSRTGPSAETVYRLCARADWTAAEARGAFKGSDHDRADGFIHLSSAGQVAETCARHYAGVADLALISVDSARLGAGLKWEVSRGGDLFPHLYGDLPVEAVIGVDDLPLGPDGRHVFPPLAS